MTKRDEAANSLLPLLTLRQPRTDCPNEIGTYQLKTGDQIYLIADNSKYVSRNASEVSPLILAFMDRIDQYCRFTVTKNNDAIALLADNKKYLSQEGNLRTD